MLGQVLQPFNGDTCPLNITPDGSVQSNPSQLCFLNQLTASYDPAQPAFFGNLPKTTPIGVSRMSLLQGPTQCDQTYLTLPFDSDSVTEIEFLAAPPDGQGNPQCNYFDTHTPVQCTIPQCDCTTRCNTGALPCRPGTLPEKVGPCLSHPTWNGWTLQGFQCKSSAWGCDWTSGKCVKVPEGTGGYTDEATCNQNCTACPAVGFQVWNDASGQPQCYRTPNRGSKGQSDYVPNFVCGQARWNNPQCNAMGSDCGRDAGWLSDCRESGFYQPDCVSYCNDTIKAPFNTYQCTSQGYVKCTNPGGCDGVYGINTDDTAGCVLPRTTMLRGDFGLMK